MIDVFSSCIVIISFLSQISGQGLSDGASTDRAPCRAGELSDFSRSRSAYALSVSRITSRQETPTHLAICPGIVVPCSGILKSWRLMLARQTTVNSTYLGVWRREPNTGRYHLVGSTTVHDSSRVTADFVFPGLLVIRLLRQQRISVRKGDFLGVYYANDVKQPTVAYLDADDAANFNMPSASCVVVINKAQRSVNREITWTKQVTILDGDAVTESRAYALAAEIEAPQLNEHCQDDGDCPFNARCLTFSCNKKFCSCKTGFLPSQNDPTCRPVSLVGGSCLPSETICEGETNMVATSQCSANSMRCQCRQGYDNRAPRNFKCRPIYNDQKIRGANFSRPLLSWQRSYGLLGDRCASLGGRDEDDMSDDEDESTILRRMKAAPCWRSRGLTCRNGRCACRAGYRPKTRDEWAVYPDTLEECILPSSSAVGCFVTQILPFQLPTTTPKPTTTTKPKCFSTYTCMLLELKNRALEAGTTQKTTDDSIYTEETTVPPTTPSPIKRIGETCLSNSNCPENARCYPFTCENFICTCKLGYVPSITYRSCLPELDLGSQCNPSNVTEGICRGSMLLAGKVATCVDNGNGVGICQCQEPYTSEPNSDFDDRPGYCRLKQKKEVTITVVNQRNSTDNSTDGNNSTVAVNVTEEFTVEVVHVLGRVNDACNENRTCYPPSTTACFNGTCVCSPGYRKKLPLEYGYLPDRSSQCITTALNVGCPDIWLNKVTATDDPDVTDYTELPNATASVLQTSSLATTTSEAGLNGTTIEELNTTSEPSGSVNGTTEPTLRTVPQRNETTSSTSDEQDVSFSPTTTAPSEPATTGNSSDITSTSPSKGSTTTSEGQSRVTTPSRTRPPRRTRPTRRTTRPPRGTTTTPFVVNPVTRTSLSYNAEGWRTILIPTVVAVGVVMIIAGVVLYIAVFRPKTGKNKNQLVKQRNPQPTTGSAPPRHRRRHRSHDGNRRRRHHGRRHHQSETNYNVQNWVDSPQSPPPAYRFRV